MWRDLIGSLKIIEGLLPNFETVKAIIYTKNPYTKYFTWIEVESTLKQATSKTVIFTDQKNKNENCLRRTIQEFIGTGISSFVMIFPFVVNVENADFEKNNIIDHYSEIYSVISSHYA